MFRNLSVFNNIDNIENNNTNNNNNEGVIQIMKKL